jgi:hypothetical protein
MPQWQAALKYKKKCTNSSVDMYPVLAVCMDNHARIREGNSHVAYLQLDLHSFLWASIQVAAA